MYLITGSAGYVGSLLTRELIEKGEKVIAIDNHELSVKPSNSIIQYLQDITNFEKLEEVFKENANIQCVFHCAAQLTFRKKSFDYFYKVNEEATEVLSDLAIKYKVKNFVYISSNCVYGKVNQLNILENAPLKPFEEYGLSKLKSEQILMSKQKKINIVILRPPTIIGEGRLGILSTVFDFIKENKKLWLVGSGLNRYQFVYGKDLVSACIKASKYKKSKIFNIGSDNISTLYDTFDYLIKKTNSKTKIFKLPTLIVIPLMKIFFKLGLSPLGPYQYNMITNTYSGNTELLKKELNWMPTKSNKEILYSAYIYYINNYKSLHSNINNKGGNKQIGKEGIIKLIKWLS